MVPPHAPMEGLPSFTVSQAKTFIIALQTDSALAGLGFARLRPSSWRGLVIVGHT